MIKKVFVLALLVFVAACGAPKGELVGSWTQPIPGQENSVQGIQINSDGTASSINMHTLVYENWTMDGDMLVLTGKSIGNGLTSDFEEVYEIKTLTPEVLVLEQDGVEFEYSKVN